MFKPSKICKHYRNLGNRTRACNLSMESLQVSLKMNRAQEIFNINALTNVINIKVKFSRKLMNVTNWIKDKNDIIKTKKIKEKETLM